MALLARRACASHTSLRVEERLKIASRGGRFGLACLRARAQYGVASHLFGVGHRQEALEEQISRIRRGLFRSALQTLRLRVVRAGLQHAIPSRALIVSNHRCGADIPVIGEALDCAFLSRDDVADWPVMGTLAKAGHTIFVDRDSARSGARAIREIERVMRAQQRVCMFPEGKTFAGDHVHEFHGGAFLAAKRADAVIVPVGIAYEPTLTWEDESFAAHIGKFAARAETLVTMVVGEAISTIGPTSAIAKDARSRVQMLVAEARHIWNAQRSEMTR